MSPQEEPQGTRRVRREPGAPELVDTLPLRLSVARGGLGIELNRELQLGATTCVDLSLSLLGVQFPVDLSKGVKQFCSHRTSLGAATVRLDLAQIAALWQDLLEQTWGEPVGISIRTFSAGTGSTGLVTESPASQGQESAANNDTGTVECLAISVHSKHGALAFDLVIAPGKTPGLLVDAARSFGELPFLKENSATRAALVVLGVGLSQLGGGLRATSRGRVIELAGLAQGLCLHVLPALGFRLPSLQDQVLVGIDLVHGDLCLRIGQYEEPFCAGARALSLLALADLLTKADAAHSTGDVDSARAGYLAALDQAPSHPLLLLELADLDLSHEGRAESALAFLEEAGPAILARHGAHESRLRILEARALAASGRQTASLESLHKALGLESDAALFGQLCHAFAERESTPSQAIQWLNRAVRRAPQLPHVRKLRLGHALALGQLELAKSDAEQLDAQLNSHQQRSRLALQLAEQFRDAGFEQESVKWLKRALRLNPDDAEVMVRLAERFSEAGQELRGAELLTSAVRTLDQRREQLSDTSNPLQIFVEELRFVTALLREARFALSELLIKVNADFPTALAHLGAIDTRSEWGAYARVLEAEIHQQLKSPSARDRALLRLVEAAELGWVDPAPVLGRYRRLLAIAVPPVEPKLRAFAEK